MTHTYRTVDPQTHRTRVAKLRREEAADCLRTFGYTNPEQELARAEAVTATTSRRTYRIGTQSPRHAVEVEAI